MDDRYVLGDEKMIENVKSVLMLAALLMVGAATMISLRSLSEISTLYFTTQSTILSTTNR